MKKFTLTETELQELLRQQRELCDNAAKVKYSDRGSVGNIFPSYCYTVDHESILNAPSPLLPTEEEGTKWNIIEPATNHDLTSLASHSCTISNSIQQWEQRLYDNWTNWFIGRSHFEPVRQWIYDNVYNPMNERVLKLKQAIEHTQKLQEVNLDLPPIKMLVEVNWILQDVLKELPNVAVSDTTGSDSSNADHKIKISELREKFFKECTKGVIEWQERYEMYPERVFNWIEPYLKIPSIDWEGLEYAWLTSENSDPIDWLKTKLQDYIK